MPHWSTSPEAGRELEVEYDTALQTYRQLKLTGSKKEAYDYKQDVLQVLAADLRNARAYWRNFGEGVTVVHGVDAEGARNMVKVQHDVEGFVPAQDPEVLQDPETEEKMIVSKAVRGKPATAPTTDTSTEEAK